MVQLTENLCAPPRKTLAESAKPARFSNSLILKGLAVTQKSQYETTSDPLAACPSALDISPLSAVGIKLGGPIPPAVFSEPPIGLLSPPLSASNASYVRSPGQESAIRCDNSANDRSPPIVGGTLTVDRRCAEYKAWVGIKQRCFNPRHIRYADYGGRGISVYLMPPPAPLFIYRVTLPRSRADAVDVQVGGGVSLLFPRCRPVFYQGLFR